MDAAQKEVADEKHQMNAQICQPYESSKVDEFSNACYDYFTYYSITYHNAH